MEFKSLCTEVSICFRVTTMLFMILHSSFVYSESETSAQKSTLKWTQKESWEKLRAALDEKEFGKAFMTEQEVLRILGRPVYRRVATSFPDSGLSFTVEKCPRVMLCYEMPTFKLSESGDNGVIQYSEKAFVCLGEDIPITGLGDGPLGTVVEVTVHAVDDHRQEVRTNDGKLKFVVKEFSPELIVYDFKEPDWWQLKTELSEDKPFDTSALNVPERPFWQQPVRWARLKKNMSSRKVEKLLGKATRQSGNYLEPGFQGVGIERYGTWEYGVRGLGGSLDFSWDDSEGYLNTWTEPFWPYVMTLPIESETQTDTEDQSSDTDDSTETADEAQNAPPWALLSNWGKLTEDMSEKQVVEILGKPTYRYREANRIVLYYYAGNIPEIEDVPEFYPSGYPDALKPYLPKYKVKNEFTFDQGTGDSGRIFFEIIDLGNDRLHKTPKIRSIINPKFSQPPTQYVPYPDYSRILFGKTLEKWQQPRRWSRINLETKMEEVVSLLGIPELVAWGLTKTPVDANHGKSTYDFESNQLITYQELQDKMRNSDSGFGFTFFYGNVADYGYISLGFYPRGQTRNPGQKTLVKELREPFWPFEKKLIDEHNQEHVEPNNE